MHPTIDSRDQSAVVARDLGNWYLTSARELPWRSPNSSPWEILLSEVMAQQTPVARVVPIWQRWLKLWPTPSDLASARPDQVLKEWGNLGYPRRALRLQECAGVITKTFAGEVPQTFSELIELPGVGEYTAGAVLAFGFGKRALVLDTNVRRIIARIFLGQQFPHPSFTVAENQFAATLIPAGDENAALWAKSSMELGATLCTARVTQCEICPVARACRWRLAGFPPDQFAKDRKPQKFAGTDRQVRGLIMKQVRHAADPVYRHHLDLVWPHASQLERCIASLIADGLLEQDGQQINFPR